MKQQIKHVVILSIALVLLTTVAKAQFFGLGQREAEIRSTLPNNEWTVTYTPINKVRNIATNAPLGYTSYFFDKTTGLCTLSTIAPSNNEILNDLVQLFNKSYVITGLN